MDLNQLLNRFTLYRGVIQIYAGSPRTAAITFQVQPQIHRRAAVAPATLSLRHLIIGPWPIARNAFWLSRCKFSTAFLCRSAGVNTQMLN